jgi:hypothetical protein
MTIAVFRKYVLDITLTWHIKLYNSNYKLFHHKLTNND